MAEFGNPPLTKKQEAQLRRQSSHYVPDSQLNGGFLRQFQSQDQVQAIPEQEQDPALFDLPKGTSLSTGPITQDGRYTIGAPDNSAFRFDQTEPRVDGKLISRHGKLWLKDQDGKLIDPPEHLRMYGWANTRKTHRLLPAHFNGADSAKPLPNFKVEDWVIE
jgi:hypothetical protein